MADNVFLELHLDEHFSQVLEKDDTCKFMFCTRTGWWFVSQSTPHWPGYTYLL